MVEEGRVLSDRYRIDERIAGGGMGTVYAATDERLSRQVALKLLKDSLAEDDRFVERFKREARAAAALSHPNVAGVYDYGQDGNYHYIVMELAPGQDLARLLRDEAPLDPERAAMLAAQIAAALGHAHSAGLVHRDVKPANALVDPKDRVKVTDFGIARAIGDSTLTATGTILGTAAYLSPEQAQGAVVDARSDVYACGIVLYEMLTGAVPFTGDSAVSVAMKHLTEEVPVPSSLRPGIPAELDEVVRKATSKDPKDRYQDGAEMAAALRAGPQGDTAPVVVGAGSTMVLEEGDGETRPLLALPISRYNPERLGRIVLLSFAALAAIAAALFIWRVLQDEEPARAARRPGATKSSTQASQTPEASPSPSLTEAFAYEIPPEILGQDVKDVEDILDELGIGYEVIEQPSDAEKDTIIATSPEPGSFVAPGETITLYVSDGKGESGPPETPPGQEKKDD